MVLGMNWDYFPIGQNYAYAFWSEPDEMIIAALDRNVPAGERLGGSLAAALARALPSRAVDALTPLPASASSPQPRWRVSRASPTPRETSAVR